jgi:YbbR domain-containing protein
MKKFMKILTNNFPFKIVSVLIAIVIWYLVVYNNDPIQTNSYQVPVQVVNESYIANGKQQFVIDESYKTVTVYVTGNRSALREIDKDDIKVVADLTQIVDLDRDPVMVPLSVSLDGFDESNIELSRYAIPIVIENVASKELLINTSTGNTSPNNGFEVGSLTPNQSTVTVYGPESIINSIDSVTAEIDINGLDHDDSVQADLVFIDKNQDVISDAIIENDITFVGGKPDIYVAVDLWRIKSDINLKIDYTGTPADGFMIGSILTTPDQITLAGTDKALEKIEENDNSIDIPADLIDVSGLSSDKQIELDLTELIPEDTKIPVSTSSNLIVNITVLPVGTTEFALDVDKIEVKNLNPDYTVSYDKQEITLRVNGSLSEIYNLSSGNIKASIDLINYKTGDYTVPLSVELPDSCSLTEQPSVSIHIKSNVENQ